MKPSDSLKEKAWYLYCTSTQPEWDVRHTWYQLDEHQKELYLRLAARYYKDEPID